MATRPQAVVIGASAGAVEALSAILPRLPASFPIPVIAVVHVPSDRRSAMAELFAAKCQLSVQEASDKQQIQGGVVWFAPANYHLLIEADCHFSLSVDEPVMFSRPSIDVTFESAADTYGAGLVGIILTGANSDGAGGLQAVIKSGGVGVVQQPEGAGAPAMPTAAIRLSPAAQVMSLDEIAVYLEGIT